MLWLSMFYRCCTIMPPHNINHLLLIGKNSLSKNIRQQHQTIIHWLRIISKNEMKLMETGRTWKWRRWKHDGKKHNNVQKGTKGMKSVELNSRFFTWTDSICIQWLWCCILHHSLAETMKRIKRNRHNQCNYLNYVCSMFYARFEQKYSPRFFVVLQ